MQKVFVPLLFSSALLAQAEWTQLSPLTVPTIRTEVGMVSDGTGALLFGGLDGPSQTAYDELWRFDGTDWTLLAPAASPPPRSRFAMGFDPVRNRLVIFGGSGQYTPTTVLGDTWEYDPPTNTWTQMFPTTSPAASTHSRMAFDIVNVKMLMFGGSGSAAAETWHWDGIDWALLAPTNSPSPRAQVNMATDWNNGRIVLFGGSGGGIQGDTWSWDGVDWTLLSTATSPGGGGLRNGKATYDLLRGRPVIFGGARQSGGFSDSIWEYDGVDWVERLPAVRPAGRAGPGFCYVAGLGTSVLFGGYDGSNYNDTWTWQTNAPATVTTSGSGCPTSAGVPTLNVSSLPWTGDTVDLTIGNVPVGGLQFLVWDLSSATTSLAPFGYPACAAINQTAVVFALGPVPFTIPAMATFAAVQLSAQGAVIEPTGSTFGLGLTDVSTLIVGVR